MAEPTIDEMRRSHRTLAILLNGCRLAQKVGGENAKMHVGDLIALLEASQAGTLDESAPDVEGAARSARHPMTPPLHPSDERELRIGHCRYRWVNWPAREAGRAWQVEVGNAWAEVSEDFAQVLDALATARSVQAGEREDTALLDVLEELAWFEVEPGIENGDPVELTSVSGINDRQFDVVGTGRDVRAAIRDFVKRRAARPTPERPEPT